jgi:outer membrane protein insertion porin family
LKASIRETTAKPLTVNAGPKECVAVALQVHEGAVYMLDSVDWRGNQTLSSQELSTAFDVKTGDLANGLEIEEGFESVYRVLGEKGYLAASITPTPVYDDARRRVSYQIEVREGIQYRMGHIVISGVPDKDARRLADQWKLKAGSVYKASYLAEYIHNTLTGSSVIRGKVVSSSLNTHPETSTVDVTIMVK